MKIVGRIVGSLLVFSILFFIFSLNPYVKIARNGQTSMYPTFGDGGIAIEIQDVYKNYALKRGDIVSFIVLLNSDGPQAIYLKRIIGLPGEHIWLQCGKVFISGPDTDEYVLEEPYLGGLAMHPREEKDVALKTDEYFVLGDNRLDSRDSRAFGPIKRASIYGRLAVILYKGRGHIEQLGVKHLTSKESCIKEKP